MPQPLQPGTTYYWRIVSRTSATDVNPGLVAPSELWAFTTAGSSTGGLGPGPFGTAPVLWEFTIWDEDVATQLSKVIGKRVVLHYKEYRYLPTTCFGDTAYFVDRVEVQE